MANDKQDNRLAFLGALAGGLAHEIKNPLSTIGMNLQLLREDWRDARSEKERRTLRKLDVLQREVKRLESILDDFLRFAGGHELAKRPTRLNDVITEVLEFLGPRLTEGSVEVRHFLSTGVPILPLDRDAIKQVLMNLFLNAMQAMPDGGELMIRTGVEDSRIVSVEVTDTGEGIPSDLKDKIWHVYYSRRRTGTGMGLPTARRIVEEHDGAISVVSEVGKGTRFTIRLPIPAAIEGRAAVTKEGEE